MSKKIESLQKKAAEIQAQIAQAELVQKSKNRTERLAVKLLNKHPELFLADPVLLENSLASAFASIAESLKK